MNAKKYSKRIIASIVAMMLVLSCFILPATLANAASEITVKFHYLRDDGDYTDWNMWSWAVGKDGGAYDFVDSGDADGAVATVTVSGSTTELGFIVRKGNWEAKDPTDCDDRYLDLTPYVSGTIEVFCTSGTMDFTVNDDEAFKDVKVIAAKSTVTNTINVTFNQVVDEGAVTAGEFTVTAPSGDTVPVAGFELTSDTTGVITLAENLDPSKKYTLMFYGNEIAIEAEDYYSSAAFEEAYTYTGDDLGATWSAESTFFRVWAPTAVGLKLNIYAAGNGGEAEKVIDMTADVNGTWVATVEGDLNRKYYTYTATFENYEDADIVDPYARSVGVNGQRGQILDLSSTNPDNWDADERHTYENVTDMEIYEVHVRDFSISETNGIENKGKYLAFTERGTVDESGVSTGVDHLVDLGVTSVHILPSYDFGSVDETKLDQAQYNWGYGPVNYNAPEGSYSTDPYNGEVRVNEYKQMVEGLHDSGLGVIMDVVYNHTYTTQYCFNRLVPGYFYRPGSNGSGCGNDVATERSMVSKFIVDSVKYWASEYHLDGLRFDLMGLMDVDTMNAVRAAVDEVDPTIIIYGEGWSIGTKVTKEDVKLATQPNSKLTPGIGYFSDTIRDTIKGSVFDATEKGYVNGSTGLFKSLLAAVQYSKAWAASPTQAINYVDCHDNLTLWDKIRSSNPDDSEEDQIRQNNLAAAIVQTAQGVPFMMSGEEFLRTKTNDDGTFNHNSYASPDSVNELDYSRLAAYPDVYSYYKGLIEFRKAHSALRMTTVEAVDSNFHSALDSTEKGVVAYYLDGTSDSGKAEQIFVVYNGHTEDKSVTLPDGDWDVYINDTTAGTTVLDTVSGTINVPRISAMVLVKEEVPDEPDTPYPYDESSDSSDESKASDDSKTSDDSTTSDESTTSDTSKDASEGTSETSVKESSDTSTSTPDTSKASSVSVPTGTSSTASTVVTASTATTKTATVTSTGVVATGDQTNVVLFWALVLTAVFTAFVVISAKRKKKASE